MTQTITISKSTIDELYIRLERLEKVVYEKKEVESVIKIYKNEKQAGKLKKLKNIDELFA